MEIEEIKKQMESYVDLFGRSLLEASSIKHATTKDELAMIMDNHNDHIEMAANDAQNSLARFKNKLGL